MKKIIFLLFFLSGFLSIVPLRAAEEELFFTYLGPTVGFGKNQISYSGWSSDSNTNISKSIPGYFFNSGLMFDIFVRSFIGEFTLEYINNLSSGKPDVSVQALLITSTAKYSYSLNPEWSLTGGLGVYLETPPSTKSYKGGGINAAIGALYDLTRDWKIIFDVLVRYGYADLGNDSTKFSYGAKLGVVYKVGRI